MSSKVPNSQCLKNIDEKKNQPCSSKTKIHSLSDMLFLSFYFHHYFFFITLSLFYLMFLSTLIFILCLLFFFFFLFWHNYQAVFLALSPNENPQKKVKKIKSQMKKWEIPGIENMGDIFSMSSLVFLSFFIDFAKTCIALSC